MSMAHDAPYPQCACGFYARKAPDASLPTNGNATLVVHLTGRVMEYVGGYRAQHQTVVEVWLDGDPSIPLLQRRVRSLAKALPTIPVLLKGTMPTYPGGLPTKFPPPAPRLRPQWLALALALALLAAYLATAATLSLGSKPWWWTAILYAGALGNVWTMRQAWRRSAP